MQTAEYNTIQLIRAFLRNNVGQNFTTTVTNERWQMFHNDVQSTL